MSEYGVEGSPEQETNTKEANPHAIDKWAQEVTHRPKCKVGGPTGGSAGRPTRGPHRLQVPRGGLPLAVDGGLMRLGL